MRFFNVCSFDQEAHKSQPSPTYKFSRELRDFNTISLFKNSDQIFRDFIYIDDVLQIIKFFMEEKVESNIVNVGTSKPVSFEQIADKMIESAGCGNKIYIDKPKNLTTNYQNYTQAHIHKLKTAGYDKKIPSILDYIEKYYEH